MDLAQKARRLDFGGLKKGNTASQAPPSPQKSVITTTGVE
jgi:hypothetical protein